MTANPETKKIFVVTHGDKGNNPDSGLTSVGVNQIVDIGIWGIPKIQHHITKVITSTGRLSEEIYQILKPVLNNIPVEYDFIITGNLWGALEKLQNGTLICISEEILSSLGFQDLCKKGALIEISVMIRKARCVIAQDNT